MSRIVHAKPAKHSSESAAGTGFWRLITVPGSAWLLLLYVVPLLLLVTVAFTTADLVGRPQWGSFSLESFGELFTPIYLPVMGRTFVYSLVVAAVCLLAGYVVAYTISRYGGRFKLLLIVAVLLPWLVDYLIRIYAWLQILGSDGLLAQGLGALGTAGSTVNLLGTDAAVVIGLVYNVLPFMVLPIYVAIESVDRRLEEACRDLNGTAWDAFVHVTLPASVPGIASGVTITFLITFGDFATARILGGPDQYMLGNLVQDQFSGLGAMPFGGAVTLCVLVVILVVLGVFTRISREAERRLS
ncbi:ABC transporter permease [Leucobacter sp. CSA1]|uniref:ABC transporter permease n=1 Tax=Leucobacter chromiisoli TaxID=2796471 RepID=A0A934QBU2_9MICO|nr:ABC transporter permease [Leucobacter chromiisoli]MBK0420417.1 ABC transporter permease [Leucobacter chromiisoli]